MSNENGCATPAPQTNCESGPVQAYRDPTPLEVAHRRVRELETALADERLESGRLRASFKDAFDRERAQYEEGRKYSQERCDFLHNRRMTLESALKMVRRLTDDPEILTVTRLALVGDQPLHE